MMHQQTPPHVKRWLQNTWKFLDICDKDASLVKMLQEENAKLRADRDGLISEKEILISEKEILASEKKEELVNAAKEIEGLREQLNQSRSENMTLSAKFQDMKEKANTFIQMVSFFWEFSPFQSQIQISFLECLETRFFQLNDSSSN